MQQNWKEKTKLGVFKTENYKMYIIIGLIGSFVRKCIVFRYFVVGFIIYIYFFSFIWLILMFFFCYIFVSFLLINLYILFIFCLLLHYYMLLHLCLLNATALIKTFLICEEFFFFNFICLICFKYIIICFVFWNLSIFCSKPTLDIFSNLFCLFDMNKKLHYIFWKRNLKTISRQ